MKLAFLGAGKMATTIARGIVENGVLARGSMWACDPSAASRDAFTAATGVSCVDTAAGLADCNALVLAVKPQVAATAVAALPALREDVLVISIAAGIPLTTLASWFGTEKIIRTMPNTPLMVGCGATVYACAAAADSGDASLVRRIFGSLGVIREVDEPLIDAVTALSGSGPAYVFEMIQALTEAGIAVGLPAELSYTLTLQTVLGAAEMLQRGMGTPEALRQAVTSPGGTTAAGLAVLEATGFRATLAATVRAARDRSLELGRSLPQVNG